MFDIGFGEVLLIFVLGLIVLGPEKLPKVAAEVGRWIGRARGMARQFREQLEEEVNLEELRRTRQSVEGIIPPDSPAPAVPPAIPQAEAYPPASTVHTQGAAPTATSAPDAAPQSPSIPPAPEPQQPVYPDTYSHAHPTDSLGRPIPAPEQPAPASDAGQQDWVGLTDSEKSAQAARDAAAAREAAAYASSHERGT